MTGLVGFSAITILWFVIDLWFINADRKEILVPYYLEPTDTEKKAANDAEKKKKDNDDVKKVKQSKDDSFKKSN